MTAPCSRLYRLLARCAVLAWCVVAGVAHAQTVAPLDGTFGTQGKAFVHLPGYALKGPVVTSDTANGRTYIAATAESLDTPETRFVVMRLLADGTLDTSYGTQGSIVFSPRWSYGASATVKTLSLSNGSVVVGGVSQGHVVIDRLLSGSMIDTTLGAIDSQSNGTNEDLVAVMPDATGFVLVINQKTSPGAVADVKVVRIYATGAQDGFYNAGQSSSPPGMPRLLSSTVGGGTARTATCAVRDRAGFVYVAGYETAANGTLTPFQWTVLADGRSESFYYRKLTFSGAARAIALSGDQPVIACMATAADGGDVRVVNTITNTVSPPISLGVGADVPVGIAVREDRRVVVAAHSITAAGPQVMLVRLTRDLQLDSDFDTDGIASWSMGTGAVESTAMAVQADGKVIVSGTALASSPVLADASLARADSGAMVEADMLRITQAPQDVTVNEGDDVTFTIGVASPAPVSYYWVRTRGVGSSDPLMGSVASATGARSASLTLSKVSVFGVPQSVGVPTFYAEDTYRVNVSNSLGQTVSATVKLTISAPPLIVADLTPVIVTPNGANVVSFGCTGRTPMSAVWSRNGSVISTTTSPSLPLSYGDPNVVGDYQATVTNADGSATTALVHVRASTDPGIEFSLGGGPPVTAALLSVGAVTDLFATIYTSITPDMSVAKPDVFDGVLYPGNFDYLWLKDGRTITGVTPPRLIKGLRPVTLDAAGAYALKFNDGRGSVSSGVMQLGVVDTSHPRILVTRTGRTEKLNAAARGNGLAFRWLKGTSPVTESAHASGTTLATLTLTGIVDEDAADYVCEVTQGGTTLATAPITVAVVTGKPVITSSTLPPGDAGLPYAHRIATTPRADHFTISGLPDGLRFDANTGEITGTPVEQGTFRLKITASNLFGTAAAVTLPLIINAVPRGAIGTTIGYYDGEMKLRVDLAVSGGGAFTGTLKGTLLQGTQHSVSFRGMLARGVGDFTAEVPLAMPGDMGGASTLSLHLSDTTPATMKLHTSDGWADRVLTVCHNPWDAKANPATAFAGYYTARLYGYGVAPARDGCYAMVTVRTDGTVEFKGGLDDGTIFTVPTIITASGDIPVVFWWGPCRHKVIGLATVFAGTAPFYRDGALAGSLSRQQTGTKPLFDAVPAGFDYINGFDAGIEVKGAKYLPPNHDGITGPLMMEASPGAGNVMVTITGATETGGVPGVFEGWEQPGTLSTSHKITFAGSGVATGVSFTPSTGYFTGTGREHYVSNPSTGAQSLRSFTFRGVVVRLDPLQLRGIGVGNFVQSRTITIPDADRPGLFLRFSTKFPGCVTINHPVP